MDFGALGRLLLLVGAGIVLLGLILIALARLFGIGHLPGDVTIRLDNVTVFFPIVSCLILSIVLTILLNLIIRIIR